MSLQYAPAPVPEELRHRYRLDGHQSDLLITSLLRRNASEFGRLPAVLDGATVLTWADLVTSATRFGGFLWSQGLRPGDAVTWQVPNWWEALVVAHGIWSIGCVSNPIVELSRELEIGRVLDAVRPKAIVTAREFQRLRPHRDVVRRLRGHRRGTDSAGVGAGRGDRMDSPRPSAERQRDARRRRRCRRPGPGPDDVGYDVRCQGGRAQHAQLPQLPAAHLPLVLAGME